MSTEQAMATVEELNARWAALAAEHGLDGRGEVDIRQDGKWYVVEGWLEDGWARTLLFDLIPRVDGAQWIVTRLRMGRPPTSTEVTHFPIAEVS